MTVGGFHDFDEKNIRDYFINKRKELALIGKEYFFSSFIYFCMAFASDKAFFKLDFLCLNFVKDSQFFYANSLL